MDVWLGSVLKKGLQLYQIHNLDRSFDDMMLGLESWIPMYMTGQIAPYYLKGVQNNVFSHLLKVSGAAALAGEAIAGQHSAGRYTLTKQRDDIAYYTRRAEALLAQAQPLMEIYRAERAPPRCRPSCWPMHRRQDLGLISARPCRFIPSNRMCCRRFWLSAPWHRRLRHRSWTMLRPRGR